MPVAVQESMFSPKVLQDHGSDELQSLYEVLCLMLTAGCLPHDVQEQFMGIRQRVEDEMQRRDIEECGFILPEVS